MRRGPLVAHSDADTRGADDPEHLATERRSALADADADRGDGRPGNLAIAMIRANIGRVPGQDRLGERSWKTVPGPRSSRSHDLIDALDRDLTLGGATSPQHGHVLRVHAVQFGDPVRVGAEDHEVAFSLTARTQVMSEWRRISSPRLSDPNHPAIPTLTCPPSSRPAGDLRPSVEPTLWR